MSTATPTITGTSEPNAELVITGPLGETCEATADSQGDWSCDISPALAEGENQIKAEDKSLLTQLYAWLKTHVDTATDPTGNPNMGHDVDWTTATDV